MMKCSVLTLNKNRVQHLINLIIGLENNSQKPDELIIIEMSDQDYTLPQMSFPILKIHLLSHERLPLAVARNLAVQHASYDNLIFLDVDCIPAHNFVKTLTHISQRQNAIISPEILYLSNQPLPSPWTEKDLMEKGSPHDARFFPKKGLKREEDPGLFWSLAFFVTRFNFDKIGGFYEEYEGYGGEDTDFGFQAKKSHVDHFLTAQTRAYHQYHETLNPPYNHFNDIIKNATLFHKRWGVWPMHGWLESFRKQGLINWHEDHIEIKKMPS
ncbi:glycosyltransferase family 2 protein [Bartonella tamiae]|uniref:Glycosyltransferase 2-like prokaryotic type domain-containing protein n=1 Tax=Bartonella tamiae Th239 TaxID=1094558 RepID=J0ZKX4_9HYPH|nr:glycosyltransferase family A protein [Bartonella tamiae]EJF89018.1 hypothetical protein ME5_01569 [Bartonella tamiae Th239]EJF94732.1 hypothetical protein MEG_00313 [Bartonella tamiae Th307]